MTNRIKFYPQALLATLALRGYSVKAFVADNPVVCEKTIYRALKSGEISTRTLYRVCSALQISPVSLLVGPKSQIRVIGILARMYQNVLDANLSSLQNIFLPLEDVNHLFIAPCAELIWSSANRYCI